MNELARLREAVAYGELRAGRTPGAVFFDGRETGRPARSARSVHGLVSGFPGPLRWVAARVRDPGDFDLWP